jgi:dissimilatory sulfite reductase (desulfoviridin) alpha/beta subunit
MNTSWQEERKEIAVWLSGYLGMVKKWVDKILDNEDHDVDKNKILKTLDEWIKYLQDERHKIMMMKNKPTTDDEYEIRSTEQQRLDGMDEG